MGVRFLVLVSNVRTSQLLPLFLLLMLEIYSILFGLVVGDLPDSLLLDLLLNRSAQLIRNDGSLKHVLLPGISSPRRLRELLQVSVSWQILIHALVCRILWTFHRISCSLNFLHQSLLSLLCFFKASLCFFRNWKLSCKCIRTLHFRFYNVVICQIWNWPSFWFISITIELELTFVVLVSELLQEGSLHLGVIPLCQGAPRVKCLLFRGFGHLLGSEVTGFRITLYVVVNIVWVVSRWSRLVHGVLISLLSIWGHDSIHIVGFGRVPRHRACSEYF